MLISNFKKTINHLKEVYLQPLFSFLNKVFYCTVKCWIRLKLSLIFSAHKFNFDQKLVTEPLFSGHYWTWRWRFWYWLRPCKRQPIPSFIFSKIWNEASSEFFECIKNIASKSNFYLDEKIIPTQFLIKNLIPSSERRALVFKVFSRNVTPANNEGRLYMIRLIK